MIAVTRCCHGREALRVCRAALVMMSMLVTACQSVGGSGEKQSSRPADPYDYNFCGSGPAYPVIGFTFATYCGPSNLLALGRTGTLSWAFPSHVDSVLHQGQRKLTERELKQLSLLAEAAQLAGPARPGAGLVNYRLGIDFPGRPTRQRFAVLSEAETPSNRLFRAMLEMIPEKPALPDCGPERPFFDPVQFPGDRRPLSQKELDRFQENANAGR